MASRFYDKDGRAHAEIIGKNGRPRAVWNIKASECHPTADACRAAIPVEE